MKQLITLALFAAGIAANAQSKKTENYKKQVSRTPYIVWDWVDEDSTRAYQDTIPGIMKFFHKDEFEGECWESVHYFYDVEEVYSGETTKQLIRDWNSFDLDTMYYSDLLVKYHPYSGDSFRANVRPSYGVMWNESYTVDSSTIIMDDVYLDLDTLKSGEVVFHLMYMRIIEDTLYPKNQALYEHMELDENKMFGVLTNYDFSGQWMARVHNVSYDKATRELLSYYMMDSMMVVEFRDMRDDGSLREVVPIEIFHEGDLGGDWNTQFIADEDSAMTVHASYYNPNWTWMAKLIWVDQDTLRYIVEVDEVANEKMENDLKETECYAWYWEYYRLKAIKEE